MACHDKINPIGNVLEAYDLSGKFRNRQRNIYRGETYNVEIPNTPQPVQIEIGDLVTVSNNPVEFASQLVASRKPNACFAKKLFKFSNARSAENNIDQHSRYQLAIN